MEWKLKLNNAEQRSHFRFNYGKINSALIVVGDFEAGCWT